ncbi:MAG: hypothetical protein FWE82_05670 [Defluviitaleaceae bacterium]|nr:hypothetical protein [Defluviitaleaceae bacterium]
MPLYEYRKNAENFIKVSDACLNSFADGTQAVLAAIEKAVRSKETSGRKPVIAFDGWYGVDWKTINEKFKDYEKYDIANVFINRKKIAEYKQAYVTDDPGFGRVNSEGRIADLIDNAKLEKLKNILLKNGSRVRLVYGSGAAADGWFPFDLIVYFDKTRQPLLWQMWDGKLVPFGGTEPDAGYHWKEYYYCDYYLLDRQKNFLYDKMDFWAAANSPDDLKAVPRVSYDEIIQSALDYPIKEIKIFQPGPWGAYRYKDLFDVPGLECNAWNELAGPELGVIIDIGGKSFEMPFMNLMQYQEKLLGKHLTEAYPGLFPMDVWLDDGYFPKPEPAERISMPIHNHPSTDYVKRRFNEPLGRYETYYIAEAYEGANTWMGFKDDCDLEAFEQKCRDSENLAPIPDWKNFVANHCSSAGDLYLIPPGTVHAHGGNQMVLEMDTCPSAAGTEYSFFQYDFARPSWDDEKKEMTGKPVKMHLEHAFDNEKWRRESWVKGHLLSKPKVEKWSKEYQKDIYASVPEMPFEIERFRFSSKYENDTEGRFCHIPTLTTGKRVIVRSMSNPRLSAALDLWQSAVIPAAFGKYEIISEDGGYCEVVQIRWKKG